MENTQEQDLLLDIEEEVIYERATVGQRFANYLIDYIVIVIIAFVAILFFQVSSEIGANLLTALIIILYYFILEGVTNGHTLGKMVTGTKVVNEDGSSIGFSESLLRSLSRLIPFEPFSAFGGNPWHDRWTNTCVVKKK